MKTMRIAVATLLVLCIAATGVFAAGATEDAAAPRELTVWETLWFNASVSVAALQETPLYQEVERRTGIKVTWIHPAAGQETEAFNLMVASQDFPDLIYHNWLNYPGGPERAIGDNVIIRLNEIVDEHMPNLSGHLDRNPVWAKAAVTDEGSLFQIPFIRGHEDLMVFYGPQVRGDWLAELGLEVPVTLDDWEEVLVAFQENGLSEHPLTFTSLTQGGRGINAPGNAFIQPFGTTWAFHQENGQVYFGPYRDEFRDFLVFFKDWFDRGLVDPEFVSQDRAGMDAKVLNGVVGAWTNYTGSGIGAYLDALRGRPEAFEIAPAPYPVLNSGDTPFMGQRDNPLPGSGMAISTQARDPQLAAEWADFAYSEEGHILFNFGIEGESYEWTTEYPGFEGERVPEYTDLMSNDPDGRTLAQMGGLYTRSFYSGPIIQDRRYIWQYAHRPTQREAIQIWAQTDAAQHMMPNVSATPEESEELSAIMSEINTYRDEMVIRFILGQEPIGNFESFQNQLRRMGIERALEIQQAALDRYNAR